MVMQRARQLDVSPDAEPNAHIPPADSQERKELAKDYQAIRKQVIAELSKTGNVCNAQSAGVVTADYHNIGMTSGYLTSAYTMTSVPMTPPKLSEGDQLRRAVIRARVVSVSPNAHLLKCEDG